MASPASPRCFVSAPADASTGTLIDLLRRRGWTPVVLSDVAPLGTALIDALRHAIESADHVVIVLPDGPGAANAAFEAGLAWALGKQLTIIAAPDAQLPSDLSGVLIVRGYPDDSQAIDFALDQVANRPPPSRPSGSRTGTGRPLGVYAETLLERTKELDTPDAAVRLLVEAIEASGAAAVVSAGMDRGFDLGVWSDDLDAIAGNPLVVEVTRTLTEGSVRQSLLALHQSPSARLGLIVFTDLSAATSPSIAPPILAVSLEQLLVRLRDESFAEIIRDLRNRSAHGLPTQ